MHGMCFGGGMQISLGCDFRIVDKNCKLSIMEAKWGLIPDMSATITLRELIRIDIAKELTMTGRIISGEEAYKIGLVTHCSEDPMQHALTLAKEICSRSPDSVNFTKQLYQQTYRNNCSEKEALDLETNMQKRLIGSWNQLSASARNFGVELPYTDAKTV